MASPQASGRMINRDISESDGVASLSPEAAVLFMMLIPHYNSHGKMFASPGHIKDLAVPKITYLTYENIAGYLQEISEKTSVKWFKIGAKWWLHSLKFLSDHQHLREDKLGKDDLPSYEQYGSSTGVVQDLPSREEVRSLEGLKIEEEPLYDDSSSQTSDTTLPSKPEEKASSSMDLYEFRVEFQKATGQLLPGGLHEKAVSICREYSRDEIKKAFEITALQGGKTLKYAIKVLKGEPKPEARGRDRPVSGSRSERLRSDCDAIDRVTEKFYATRNV